MKLEVFFSVALKIMGLYGEDRKSLDMKKQFAHFTQSKTIELFLKSYSVGFSRRAPRL